MALTEVKMPRRRQVRANVDNISQVSIDVPVDIVHAKVCRLNILNHSCSRCNVAYVFI